MPPKYARPEFERRWLVAPQAIPPLGKAIPRLIEDRYLDGSNLRLRAVYPAGKPPVFKLGKKFGDADGVAYTTTIYLSEAEYQVFDALPGATIRKRRYTLFGGALDRYEVPDLPYAIFEIEFSNQSVTTHYVPPEFVNQEITDNPHYTGYAIALSQPGLATAASPGTR
jgi:CYTH domain-containing protein